MLLAVNVIFVFSSSLLLLFLSLLLLLFSSFFPSLSLSFSLSLSLSVLPPLCKAGKRKLAGDASREAKTQSPSAPTSAFAFPSALPLSPLFLCFHLYRSAIPSASAAGLASNIFANLATFCCVDVVALNNVSLCQQEREREREVPVCVR